MNTNVGFRDFLTPAWFLILIGLAIGGGVALYEMFVGHILATTQVMVWTTPLIVYISLALTSSGISIILAYGILTANDAVLKEARYLLLLDIAVLLGGFVALATELGSILNMVWILLSPNPASPIWWMGTFYSIKLAVIFVKLVLDLRGIHGPIDTVLSWLTLIVAAAAAMTIGSAFGTIIGTPDYRGAFASVILVLVAPTSGAALLVMLGRSQALSRLINPVFRRLAGLVLVMLILQMVYETRATTEGLIGWVHPLMLVLFALAALLGARAPKLSSLSAMLGSFSVIYGFIITGQLTVKGPKVGWFGEITTFMPNWSELAVIVLGVSVAAAIFRFAGMFMLSGQTRPAGRPG